MLLSKLGLINKELSSAHFLQDIFETFIKGIPTGSTKNKLNLTANFLENLFL